METAVRTVLHRIGTIRDENATRQVSMLLYCLGEEAEAVLSSTNITNEERNVFNTVIGKFDAFFKV